MTDAAEHRNGDEHSGPHPGEATMLLQAIGRGDKQAAADLLPLVYEELRKLAEARMSRLPPGQTMQPTALVHEAYMELVGGADPGWNGRAHFFGAAAQAMREILIDAARRRSRKKRGGDRRRVTLSDEAAAATELPWSPEHLLIVDEAIETMRGEFPRPTDVVMFRFYAGMSNAMTAEVMNVSERTVERDWRFARAWLHKALAERGVGDINI